MLGYEKSFNPCSLGCCSERSVSSYVSLLIITCFNPCSLGCCSESSLEKIPRMEEKEFQSLFSWMLLWKCLKGCRRRSWVFVSILVLLDVALKAAVVAERRADGTRFQSLFSWMLLWKRAAQGLLQRGKRSFNPCSLGCCSERVHDDRPAVVLLEVSILVLLDVALKVPPGRKPEPWYTSFNPCSLGCCSESGAPGESGTYL